MSVFSGLAKQFPEMHKKVGKADNAQGPASDAPHSASNFGAPPARCSRARGEESLTVPQASNWHTSTLGGSSIGTEIRVASVLLLPLLTLPTHGLLPSLSCTPALTHLSRGQPRLVSSIYFLSSRPILSVSPSQHPTLAATRLTRRPFLIPPLYFFFFLRSRTVPS